MRESVIDVLFYLFDDILPTQENRETDLNQMAHWLSEAGFAHEDVGRAMDWFYELSQLDDYQPQPETDGAVRVFSPREQFYIDATGQDFLHGLRRSGVIDMRLQKVIERALALEEPLDLETLRWVTLMVMMNSGAELEHWPAGEPPGWFYPEETKTIH